MTPEFEALADAVGRIRNIEVAIKSARGIPGMAKYHAGRFKIYAEPDHYNPIPAEISARMKAAAVACGDQLALEGKSIRDEKLAALSIEIHGIRATLPGLAAKAAISLGECASDLLNPEGAA